MNEILHLVRIVRFINRHARYSRTVFHNPHLIAILVDSRFALKVFFLVIVVIHFGHMEGPKVSPDSFILTGIRCDYGSLGAAPISFFFCGIQQACHRDRCACRSQTKTNPTLRLAHFTSVREIVRSMSKRILPLTNIRCMHFCI